MSVPNPSLEEVDQLLLNAQLRGLYAGHGRVADAAAAPDWGYYGTGGARGGAHASPVPRETPPPRSKLEKSLLRMSRACTARASRNCSGRARWVRSPLTTRSDGLRAVTSASSASATAGTSVPKCRSEMCAMVLKARLESFD